MAGILGLALSPLMRVPPHQAQPSGTDAGLGLAHHYPGTLEDDLAKVGAQKYMYLINASITYYLYLILNLLSFLDKGNFAHIFFSKIPYFPMSLILVCINGTHGECPGLERY